MFDQTTLSLHQLPNHVQLPSSPQRILFDLTKFASLFIESWHHLHSVSCCDISIPTCRTKECTPFRLPSVVVYELLLFVDKFKNLWIYYLTLPAVSHWMEYRSTGVKGVPNRITTFQSLPCLLDLLCIYAAYVYQISDTVQWGLALLTGNRS